MSNANITTISIETIVNQPVAKVWEYWGEPEHIAHWNNASDDWFTPSVENDLQTGGKFNFRMQAKDGTFGFDFAGTYDAVTPNELIAYTIGDGRKVNIVFTPMGNQTKIVENFEAETVHSIDMQRDGWQAILNNFKKYAESIQ